MARTCGLKNISIADGQKVPVQNVIKALKSTIKVKNLDEAIVQSYKYISKGVSMKAWDAWYRRAYKIAKTGKITIDQIDGGKNIGGYAERLQALLNRTDVIYTEDGGKIDLLPETVDSINSVKNDLASQNAPLSVEEIVDLVTLIEASVNKGKVVNNARLKKVRAEKAVRADLDPDVEVTPGENYTLQKVLSYSPVDIPTEMMPNYLGIVNALSRGDITPETTQKLMPAAKDIIDIMESFKVDAQKQFPKVKEKDKAEKEIRVKKAKATTVNLDKIFGRDQEIAKEFKTLTDEDYAALNNRQMRDLLTVLEQLNRGIVPIGAVDLLSKMGKTNALSTEQAQDIADSIAQNTKDKNAWADVQSGANKKAAIKARKGKGFGSKASDLLFNERTEDYAGLMSRYEFRYGKDENYNRLEQAYELYQSGYDTLWERTAELRKEMEDGLKNFAKSVGVKRSNINKYMEKGSGVVINGTELDRYHAMKLWMNRLSDDIPDSVRDEVDSKLDQRIKDYGDSLFFNIELGEPIKYAFEKHIKKTVANQALSDFKEYRKQYFGENEVAQLETKMGDRFGDSLTAAFDRMELKDDPYVNEPELRGIEGWFLGGVGSTMFLNVKSAVQQGISIWNYATPGGVFRFNRDLAMVFVPGSKQQKLFVELWNDPMATERRAAIGFDINASEMKAALDKGSLSGFNSFILGKGFLLTSAMDSVAIAAGGQASVLESQRKGMSKEDAKKKWRRDTQEHQQSSRGDRVSQQQKSSVGKWLLAFANAPAQFFRIMARQVRIIRIEGAFSKKGLIAQRKLAFYSLIVNFVFNRMSLGDDDEEKIANGMLDSILRGSGVKGNYLVSIKNTIVNVYKELQKPKHLQDLPRAIIKGVSSMSPPVSRKVQDVYSISDAYKWNPDGQGAENPNVTAVAKGSDALFNFPVFNWLQKRWIAIQKYNNGEASLGEMGQMLYGYSAFNVLGAGPKGKPGRPKKGNDLDLDLELELDLDIDLDLDL